MNLSYIDPETAQHVFGGFGAWLLGFFGLILGFLIWPLRMLYMRTKLWYGRQHGFVRGAFLCSCALALMGLGSLGTLAVLRSGSDMAASTQTAKEPSKSNRKVIVIGMDGLDPNIVEEMMAKGELPNFSKLASMGSYSRLQTSLPPESPVAWSCIACGCNPGEHGIFDFIHRDPKTYTPYLSLRKSTQGFSGTKYENPRQRDGFWVDTSKAGIPTTVVRWPVAFPPEQVNGRFLSGFGTPDLLGGEGRYTYFTSDKITADDPSSRNVVEVQWDGKFAVAPLQGPTTGKGTNATAQITATRLDANSISLKVDGSDAVTATRGQWSSWLRVRFKVGFSSIEGNVKFMLTDIEPSLKLTCSPIQIAADRQAFPISCPESYAQELEREIGPFHTLGMPEQIHPLSHDRYDYDAFLAECRAIMSERRKMLRYELARFDKGLLAFVFDTSDRIQHAFWFTRDPEHPIYEPVLAAKYVDVIPNMYREMDDIAGEVLSKVDSQTTLIVLSDHGFTSFRHAVHLNRWLIQNGYMTLRGGNDKEGRELFRDVDWSQTKAYALGFTSIYLNLRGREGQGCVAQGAESAALATELAAKLKSFAPVNNTFLGGEVYQGTAAVGAPELIVGFKRGYRASWQTALGGAPKATVEDNRKKWSGDHLVDPSLVPGVFLSNRHYRPTTLMDIKAVVLQGTE